MPISNFIRIELLLHLLFVLKIVGNFRLMVFQQNYYKNIAIRSIMSIPTLLIFSTIHLFIYWSTHLLNYSPIHLFNYSSIDLYSSICLFIWKTTITPWKLNSLGISCISVYIIYNTTKLIIYTYIYNLIPLKLMIVSLKRLCMNNMILTYAKNI